MNIRVPLLFTIVLFHSCVAYQLPIQRDTAISEKPEVDMQRDGTALIRTAHCDISLRHISPDEWKSVISSTSVFSGTRKVSAQPPYEIFFVTIQNSTNKTTIRDIRFSIKTPVSAEDSLSVNELIDESAVSSFENMNIAEIFSFRRLLINEYALTDINFEKDTAGYPFPFILPKERSSIFIAFRIPPFEYRRYTLSVEYRSGNDKKIVDFEVVRKENRPD